ncbi:thermonuclease family protein [Trichloromonas sp.]|uniref:thermonuclease family protein n=1 Tax=Trichloromonas sp. TaxID=3069249 RepID=UPI003D81B369
MSRSPFRTWLRAALLALFFTLALGCAEADQQGPTGTVSWIYDGDTLKVDGIGKVRLLGIDTPEKKDSSRDHYLQQQGVSSKVLRRMAKESLQFNIAEVKGKRVRLEFDGNRQDRHGRTLAYVYLPDGTLLNRLLIEKGYAVVYRRFDFRLKEDFLRAEAAARDRRAGVWQK